MNQGRVLVDLLNLISFSKKNIYMKKHMKENDYLLSIFTIYKPIYYLTDLIK